MARYIETIIQPGEAVLYSTNAHWIYHLPGILMWIVAAACLVAWRTTLNETLIMLSLVAAAVFGLIALALTLRAAFRRWTTETDVTDRRVIHKTGFIRRRTFEMSLDKVESVDVNQSIAGRLLDYGDVTVRGVGEGFETIRTIASPLAFRNAITARALDPA